MSWTEREAEIRERYWVETLEGSDIRAFCNEKMEVVDGHLLSEEDALQLATDIAACLAEIERLKNEVECAYREGVGDAAGIHADEYMGPTDNEIDQMWVASEAFADLPHR